MIAAPCARPPETPQEVSAVVGVVKVKVSPTVARYDSPDCDRWAEVRVRDWREDRPPCLEVTYSDGRRMGGEMPPHFANRLAAGFVRGGSWRRGDPWPRGWKRPGRQAGAPA